MHRMREPRTATVVAFLLGILIATAGRTNSMPEEGLEPPTRGL
jgi:hypothetical protein